jgi:hypothetical protein
MSRFTHISNLASWLQSKARTLSYNDQNGPLKHQLLEAAHALDSSVVLVSRRGLRLFVRNVRGKQRRLTLREHVAYLLLNGSAEIRP